MYHFEEFKGQTSWNRDFINSLWNPDRLGQVALYNLGIWSSFPIVQASFLNPIVPFPIKLDYRGCFMCNKTGHWSKDYPCCVIRATSISVMIGRGFKRGARGRDGGVCGGCLWDTQLVDGHG